MRSSQQQLNDELKKMYDEMTDPVKRAEKNRKEEIERNKKDKIKDYGL